MADKIILKKGLSTALPAVSNGQMLFTTDTGYLYIDDAGSRTQVNANIANKLKHSLALFNVDGDQIGYFDASGNTQIDLTPANLGALGVSATAVAANKVTSALSINGKTFDGSSPTDVGIIGADYGGTGQTSLVNSMNALINSLGTGSSTPIDQDYFISQTVGGGTTNTIYNRRPLSALYDYVEGKTDNRYLKLSGGTITSNLVVNGNVTVDNGNSSGAVALMEDDEGGTILLKSKNGTYQYHIDAYNDETIRMHTADLNPNGAYKQISWNGKTGELITASFTGSLNGNADTATTAAACSGNAATATKLATAQTIALAGDVTGSGSFDGSNNLTINTSFSITLAPSQRTDNVAGYRLIGTSSANTWKNMRDVWVVASRHTGAGLLSFCWGHNANNTTASSAYGEIVYTGPKTGGSVYYEDGFQIYYNESTATFYLFWKYSDYNSTYIMRLLAGGQGGWSLVDGADMDSIDTATYGNLICKITPCWYQGNAVTGAVWNA